MAVSSYLQNSSFSSVPLILWEYYLEYLWYYDPSSWVAKVSSTVRVLAFLLILPVAILAMLDISSYVVARTLGVVDVAKASTTDTSTKTVTTRLTIPSIRIEDTSSSSPGLSDTPSDTSSGSPPDTTIGGGVTDEDSSINGFAGFSGLDESMFSNEELSGVGVFSPATSRSSSPTLTRRRPFRESGSYGAGLNVLPEDLGLSVQRRLHLNRSGVDTSGQD